MTGTDNGCSKSLDTCNWMAKFADSTKLVAMNLPGTHDTSTCNSTSIFFFFFVINNYLDFRELLRCDSGFTHKLYGTVSRQETKNLDIYLISQRRMPPAYEFRCQENSILQSLNDGIRVFDLRIAYNPGNDTIGFWHSECLSFQSLYFNPDFSVR